MINMIRAQLTAVVTALVITPALFSPTMLRADGAVQQCSCQYTDDPSYAGEDLYQLIINAGAYVCDTHPIIYMPGDGGPALQAEMGIYASSNFADVTYYPTDGASSVHKCSTKVGGGGPSTSSNELSAQEALACITAINEACRNAGFQ